MLQWVVLRIDIETNNATKKSSSLVRGRWMAFPCEVCMFSPCRRGFSLSTSAFSHSPKTGMIRLIGDFKWPLGVNVWPVQGVFPAVHPMSTGIASCWRTWIWSQCLCVFIPTPRYLHCHLHTILLILLCITQPNTIDDKSWLTIIILTEMEH